MAQSPSPDTYSPFLLIHNVMRMLTADGCKPVLRVGTEMEAARAASDLLKAFGIEPTETEGGR